MRRRALLAGLAAGLAPGFAPLRALARCEGVVPETRLQNTFAHDVGDELDDILSRGWIEFAVYDDFAPYSWTEGGKPRGVDIDLGRLIAQEMGIEPRFRMVLAGETLDTDLRDYVWKGATVGGHVSNVMLHVPYDSAYACRVDQVVFTGQYFEEAIVIAYRRDAYPDDEKPVPAYFRYDDVGVENDSISDFYLTSVAGAAAQTHIHRYRSTVEAMAALAAGQLKAVMGPRGQVEFGLTEAGAYHAPPLPGFARGHWTLGAAVHISHTDLGYSIGDAVTAGLADGRIAAIFERYGLSFTPPAS